MNTTQEHQHTKITKQPTNHRRPLVISLNRHEQQQGTSFTQSQHQQHGTSDIKAQHQQGTSINQPQYPQPVLSAGDQTVQSRVSVSRYPFTSCGSTDDGQKDIVDSPAPLSASLICKELQDIAIKCQTMASQIDCINVGLSLSETSPDEASSETTALIEKNFKLTTEISELKSCKDEWKRRCSYLEEKLSLARKAGSPRQDDDKTGINAVVKESKRQIESLETKLTKTELEAGSLKKQLDELNVMVTHMSAQLVTYKEDFETERRDRERAQGRIAELETQLLISESQSYTGEHIGRTSHQHHHHPRQHLFSRGSYDMCDDVQTDNDGTYPPSAISVVSQTSLNDCTREPKDCSVEPKDCTRDPKNYTKEHKDCTRDSKDCMREHIKSNGKSSKRQFSTNGIEETHEALLNTDSRYSVRDVDETDHGLTDKTKPGRIIPVKRQTKLVSALIDRFSATFFSEGSLGRTESDTKEGVKSEADDVTTSSVEGDCKWYLGTPRGEVNKISFVDGKGLIVSNGNVPLVEEAFVSIKDSQILRKELIDVNCHQSARSEHPSAPSPVSSSTYIKTSGCTSSERTRLLGSSTADYVTLTPRCPEDTEPTVASLFHDGTGGCTLQSRSENRSRKDCGSSADIEVDCVDDSDDLLQCPKCRKRFRIEDHYLLMEHMEDVCMQY